MVTVGIDLAAQPENTAACEIRWGDDVQVADAFVGLRDQDIIDLLRSADHVGIDVPLGWPVAFSAALADHGSGRRWPPASSGKTMTHRATDHFVHEKTGSWPLSVSADKIAIPAMRAARLLSDVEPAPDRAGRGVIVEVYPAAALRMWGFDPRGYKGRDGHELRRQLVEAFLKETGAWVTVSASATTGFLEDDNKFDAFIAALVARAWATGRCWRPTPAGEIVASIEGWIAVPQPGTLGQLTEGAVARPAD